MSTIKFNLDLLDELRDAANDYSTLPDLIHALWEQEMDFTTVLNDIQTGCMTIRPDNEDSAAALERLRNNYDLPPQCLAERIWNIRAISKILAAVADLVDIVATRERAERQAPAPAPTGNVWERLHAEIKASQEQGKRMDAILDRLEREQADKYREQDRPAEPQPAATDEALEIIDNQAAAMEVEIEESQKLRERAKALKEKNQTTQPVQQ